MKGYAQVDLDTVKAALSNREKVYLQGKVALAAAITRFATLKREKSWFSKWWYKGKTDREVARAHLSVFQSWDDILYEVCDEDQLNLVTLYSYGCFQEKHDRLKALVEASSTGILHLGPELSHFISRFKEV